MAAIKHIFNELHYEMTRKIADGGMGVVYEAQQLGADPVLALLHGRIDDRQKRAAHEEEENDEADRVREELIPMYELIHRVSQASVLARASGPRAAPAGYWIFPWRKNMVTNA